MLRLHNPDTGITLLLSEPSTIDPDSEQAQFTRRFMESKPGDAFDVAFKKKLGELADEWERIQAKREADNNSQAERHSAL